MQLPRMVRIKQRFDKSEISDVRADIRQKTAALKPCLQIKPGQRVAVACSSRGICNYSSIVGATISELKQLGLKPFIIPAMGSHGGGTAAGQTRVLAAMGITEQTMGVPVQSDMKTVSLGHTDDNIPVFIDKIAAQADWIVPVNRIKSHTMFNGEIESGLMKMLAIGLGKQDGPAIYHNFAFDYGLEHVIRTVSRVVMKTIPVLFGVGIVENAYSRPARIGVFSPEQLEQKEAQYLKISKNLEPGLPLDKIDVLIIDEMGKDISGAGIDCNVIGRIDMPLLTENPESPQIKRIIVCDLTDKSEGNAIGVGLADFMTRQLMNKINIKSMNVNAVTACDPEHAKLPMILENDWEAVSAATSTIGITPLEKMKIVRIQNTKQLYDLVVSEACLPDLINRPDIQIEPEPFEMCFNTKGNMEPFR